MLHEKKRLAKEAGLTVEEASDYMRRWRNADREARALHKFTEVRVNGSGAGLGIWTVVVLLRPVRTNVRLDACFLGGDRPSDADIDPTHPSPRSPPTGVVEVHDPRGRHLLWVEIHRHAGLRMVRRRVRVLVPFVCGWRRSIGDW